ncbi:MAG: diadenylate cyclase CdaA [Butyrivibrio sp.]|uniref:Diadenylate cyclase n=1 Tax=Butyrivibrio hungatei TaxID=185008 RepID=A0A1G5CE13_9FIRM|nr:diadenylate cyclase CdaA [Butyrivibrio hungatei]MBQ2608917.1 diadenylate cyclase CdaA [Butyrivibrio sp.]MBQ4218541.1 diadenylate cyclase CdaA [Butyrivibrio sp.]MBR4357028.1 diadenylate cyclase CdaA [Butyrivibrio sp.]MCR4997781.1 diadenylate cyclase CdaA [Butyrivibrio sp.]MEE3469478.1 diadenylate cyclase CdaA [Butyrivibrio hungatei]
METVQQFFDLEAFRIPSVRPTDILEILIIAFLVYHVLLWAKNSRLWSMLKGVIVIMAFILFAEFFQMNTILWIVGNFFNVIITVVVIILQPELRKALEELGRKNFFSNAFFFGDMKFQERFSDKTLNEIVRACVEMSKVRTGALIVIQQDFSLAEFERTGIAVDGIVTSQLLINIFEHNTPLHDGAVIIRGDRVVSATCYLPLSDNMGIGKELGTRHRAGIGVSEVTDSLTIIVSEETGKISVAYEGELDKSVDSDRLRDRLKVLQNKHAEETHIKHFARKARVKR